MTIDELGVMVKRGFDAVDKRFEGVDKGFEGVDKRFEGIEKKMDAGFEGVNRRIDLLREDVSDLPEIREELHDLDKRMDRVERKVGITR